uniref:Photosystem I assembly protein Ycf4 n=1 Tax=Chloromonas radiata TaxID=47907 RepID=A0A0S2ID60_9CHLO|nr:hypothetical chloroplast RF4 [Chloromonas radiata]
MKNSLTNLASSSIYNLESRSKQIELNRRYFIVGERRISNYWWASVIFLGGSGFLLTGISSYIKYNIFSFIQSNDIVFFPQGLLLCFYGSLGVLLSLYWWLLIYWNVGGGFNEFNKKEGFMRIFRWGYPGKNRRLDLVYSLKDIEAIRVEFKQSQGLLSGEQTIYVRLLSTTSAEQKNDKTNQINEGKMQFKEKREIPLGGIGQPLTLKEIEKQASELANFLQVALEGL